MDTGSSHSNDIKGEGFVKTSPDVTDLTHSVKARGFIIALRFPSNYVDCWSNQGN